MFRPERGTRMLRQVLLISRLSWFSALTSTPARQGRLLGRRRFSPAIAETILSLWARMPSMPQVMHLVSGSQSQMRILTSARKSTWTWSAVVSTLLWIWRDDEWSKTASHPPLVSSLPRPTRVLFRLGTLATSSSPRINPNYELSSPYLSACPSSASQAPPPSRAPQPHGSVQISQFDPRAAHTCCESQPSLPCLCSAMDTVHAFYK